MIWAGDGSDDYMYPDDLASRGAEKTASLLGGVQRLHGVDAETVDPRQLSLSRHSQSELGYSVPGVGSLRHGNQNREA